MSHNYYDSFEGGNSDCCGASILLGGICNDCGEHCEEMDVDNDENSE